jgi:hypothetical protein
MKSMIARAHGCDRDRRRLLFRCLGDDAFGELAWWFGLGGEARRGEVRCGKDGTEEGIKRWWLQSSHILRSCTVTCPPLTMAGKDFLHFLIYRWFFYTLDPAF